MLPLAPLVLSCSLLVPGAGFAQNPPPQRLPGDPAARLPTAPDPIEKLGPNQLRIGAIKIDTARREVTVPGVINGVEVVEFLATTKGGFKSYESAIELDATGINFNLAMILIGLDKAHAQVPEGRTAPPSGDPVEIWVSWDERGQAKRFRAEDLVYNARTKSTLARGPWVYTGSAFTGDNKYIADLDGTLIGFAHTNASVIENPGPVPQPYPAVHLNPTLGLRPGIAVTVSIRALDRGKQ